jgi:hypothetical protein
LFMNRINRFLVSLVALFLVVSAVVTVLVAADALEYRFLPGASAEDEAASTWFESELRGLAESGGAEKTVSIAAALAVIAAMLGLLALQAKGGTQRRGTPLLVSSTDLGVFNIDPASVRLLVERTGSYNRDIVDIRCGLHLARKTLSPGPDRVVISCHPVITLGSDAQAVRDDLQARVKEVVERLTGLEVQRVNITRVRYDQGQETRLIE